MSTMQHHLAILLPEYLEAILAGRKTIECRLGRRGSGPYQAVAAADLIWLKERCGPVRGVASVARVEWFEDLCPARVDRLREEFNRGIRAPGSFWEAHRQARVASLVWFAKICSLRPFRVQKVDREAWVVLAEPPVPGRGLIRRPRPLA
jgi:ASC-1-like (ASCH) protein